MSQDHINDADLSPGLVLVLLERGLEAMKLSRLSVAEQMLNLAWTVVQRLPREQAGGGLPLALCCRAMLEKRRGNAVEAAELRARAMPLVDEVEPAKQEPPFLNMMANVLMQLAEYRRAIQFIEETIQQVLERNNPVLVAELLHREGLCYARSGLKEQAAVPLRAALKILRDYPGEPILPTVLITLGNALRKTAAGEAERLYSEAAEIYEAKAQLESATSPWVNLGLLCSEQGRYSESLDYYERALRVRERTPSTPPARIASLLNNMANTRRRMGDLDEALRLIDRALAVPNTRGDAVLASLLGTRGQILHDAQRDDEAVEWLRKSHAERRKSSSPDLDSLAENLEVEIGSLERLGRFEERREAEKQLEQVRREQADAPQATVNVGTLRSESAGTVMIEFPFGARGGRYELEDAKTIAGQLGAILFNSNAGAYSGRVVIPESITLTFHGTDANVMYCSMSQFLADHCIFAGATVSIRQGREIRQVVIPQLLN